MEPFQKEAFDALQEILRELPFPLLTRYCGFLEGEASCFDDATCIYLDGASLRQWT